MRVIERGIADIVGARLASLAERPVNVLWRIEDLAITHMRSLAYGAAGAVLALGGTIALSDREPPLPSDPIIVGSILEPARVPAQAQWQPVRKPTEIMSLQAPQFQKQPSQYFARANASGDREDGISFDNGPAGGAEARVLLRRAAAEAVQQPSLFIEMTRQQAERGVAVTRAGSVDRLETKFGPASVADMTFTDQGGRSQACLSFRTEGRISISGWYCAEQGAAVERPEAACFIDRLALLKAGEDRDLRRFFVEAEQRRRPCPTTRVSTGRKPTWLDSDGKAPAMRDITGSIGEKPKR